MLSAEELVVFAGPALERARVAIVGMVDDAALAEVSARSIHRFEADPTRVSGDIAHFPGTFSVRDGAYDVVVCTDIAALTDVRTALVEFRRVLGRNGILVLASDNHDRNAALGTGKGGLGYYELYDTVALQFHSVRMYGAASFFGHSVSELGNEDPDVAVDGSLATDDKIPDGYVVVASQTEERVIPGYALIELSKEQILDAVDSKDDEPLVSQTFVGEDELRANNLELVEARHEIDRLARALHDERSAHEESRRALRELGDLQATAASLQDALLREREKTSAFEKEIGLERARATDRSREVQSLGRELEELRADTSGKDASAKVEKLTAELGRASAELARATEALAKKAAALTTLEKRVEELSKVEERAKAEERTRPEERVKEEERIRAEERAKTEERIRAEERAKPAVKEATSDESERTAEVASYEGKVKELGHEIEKMRRALADRGRIVEDLLRSPTPADETALRGKVDHLALEVARRESEVRASAWRIAELEEQLKRRDSRPARS